MCVASVPCCALVVDHNASSMPLVARCPLLAALEIRQCRVFPVAPRMCCGPLACRLLSDARCLLHAARCPLPVVCCLLRDVCRLLHAACCVLHRSYGDVASCVRRLCRVAHWLSHTVLRAWCWLCADRCSPHTKYGSAACCMLQLACARVLLHVVCCLLHGVCCMLPVARCRWFAVCCAMSAV